MLGWSICKWLRVSAQTAFVRFTLKKCSSLHYWFFHWMVRYVRVITSQVISHSIANWLCRIHFEDVSITEFLVRSLNGSTIPMNTQVQFTFAVILGNINNIVTKLEMMITAIINTWDRNSTIFILYWALIILPSPVLLANSIWHLLIFSILVPFLVYFYTIICHLIGRILTRLRYILITVLITGNRDTGSVFC